MSKKPAVGHQMTETNDIAVLDRVATAFHRDRGNDLPIVVGVVVGIACDLLTLGRDTAIFVAKWVLVHVRVKVDLGLLVLHRDVVKVIDTDRLLGHEIVTERLLEFGSHEIVARS